MLEALIKVWPILAALGGIFTTVLVWMASSIWKVARWTVEHDAKTVAIVEHVGRIDARVQAIEAKTLTHDSAIIRLEARR